MSKKYNYIISQLINLSCPQKRFEKKQDTTFKDELEICDLLICYKDEEREEIFALLKTADKDAYKKVMDLWQNLSINPTLKQELNKYIRRKNELTDEMEAN